MCPAYARARARARARAHCLFAIYGVLVLENLFKYPPTTVTGSQRSRPEKQRADLSPFAHSQEKLYTAAEDPLVTSRAAAWAIHNVPVAYQTREHLQRPEESP